MLENSLIKALENSIKSLGFNSVKIASYQPISGGSINEAYRLKTNHGYFFVKINSADRFPQLFEKEIMGLLKLKENTSLKVPNPLIEGEDQDYSFLIMEYISEGNRSEKFWENFGHGLASLHQKSANSFGLEYDNYVGSLKQKNLQKKKWSNFFLENRIQYQESLAESNNRLDKETKKLLELLYIKKNQLFPEEPPSLLHGDLWSGNFMISEKGEAVIMDPAIYYGHREMDIAMSHLFGGFHPLFYKAYEEVYPLEKGWQHRLEICNLYPLFVHVNLFGTAYGNRLKSSLSGIMNRL